jgi:hypothetical protein
LRGASLDDVREHMADFKSYGKVDVTPAGWYPRTDTLANIRLQPTAAGVSTRPPRLKRKR